jgi:asparagine synthase (glutamine-hydrolysing)
MCGIVGILNKDQAVNMRQLKEMADAIHHRGPDDEGHYLDKNLGFYHKRLSIIDPEMGKQPMETERYCIVFNGEIYNYIELKSELAAKGHQFRTQSDTEVILRLYEEYGQESINQLNGMFAFLLYDKPRQQLIAARDHFGIKPLYYYHDGNKWVFASEIKALLQHVDIRARVNREALTDYLTFQFILGEETLFKDIKKFMPGRYMIINLNTFAHESVNYWSPNFSVDKFHTERYFIHHLRNLVEDSVRMQLRSDVTLGSYLSGGIDSSLVTGIASQFLDKSLPVFSGAFNEGPEFSEMQYVEDVVEKNNSQLHKVYPSASDFVELLPRLIYLMDEPAAGPGLFPQYMVSRLASEHVKVVLGGQGGDEIFGGYARYVVAYLEQALKGAINGNTDEGEHIVSLQNIIPNLRSIEKYQPMIKKFWSEGVFKPMDQRYFHLIDRMNGSISMYDPEFITDYSRDAIFKRFQTLFNDPNTFSYFNKMTNFDMFGSLPALLHVEDRMSMGVSIESRVPLLDRRIVDLVAKMPPAMKFKGGKMKHTLVQSVGDYLPESIQQRNDKMGFPVPLHLWAKKEARDFIGDILLSQKSKERNIFNTAEIEKLITNERPFGRQLWGMLCLELWFRTFIDNP